MALLLANGVLVAAVAYWWVRHQLKDDYGRGLVVGLALALVGGTLVASAILLVLVLI